MNRISTFTRVLDLFGLGKHGFRDGNLATGVVSTDLDAAWFNGVQEELLAIIEAAGIAPSEANLTQLLQAILILIQEHAPASPTAFIAEANNLTEETAAFAAGSSMVIRLDLLTATPPPPTPTDALPTATVVFSNFRN